MANPATWDRVRNYIKAMVKYEAGWNGYDASPVSSQQVSDALHLVDYLVASEIVPPTVVYSLPDGNIQLEWSIGHTVTMRIEVESHGKGELMVVSMLGSRFLPYIWPT